MLCSLLMGAALSLAFARPARQQVLPPRGQEERSACADAFDYVVVGGGTSGLVVASRLSEDPTVTVAVIEAGDSVLDNPTVQDISAFGLLLGTPLDWGYRSAPQENTNGKVHIYFAGKALGGTSILNGMTYLRPQNVQIDVWETLGNPGLNWENLFPYFLRSEQFVPPTPQQSANGASYDPAVHNTTGPLNVGWGSILQGGGAYQLYRDTWAALGIDANQDPNDGDLRGFSTWPLTLDARTDTREDSARAYLWSGASKRPNLTLFVNTTANRLEWDEDGKGGDERGAGKEPRARGVQVTTATGETKCICAKREVIVSLGSIRTPAFLELSGIGNPAILSQFSIAVRVESLRVGENLQDQPLYAANATFKEGVPPFKGYPSFVAYATAADLFPGDELRAMRDQAYASVPAYAAQVASLSNGSTTAAIQEQLLRQQLGLIFDAGLPLAELLPAAQGSTLLAPAWNLNPLSRGSVHLASAALPPSANGSAPPTVIDPNFFAADFDGRVAVAIAKLWRRALNTPPLAHLVAGEVASGGAPPVPPDADDAQWLEAIKAGYGPNYHPVGTAAMMARELGGVVDARNRVYGVANVRIVDASVLPTQVCGHLTSVLYAMAERASEIIRKDAAACGAK